MNATKFNTYFEPYVPSFRFDNGIDHLVVGEKYQQFHNVGVDILTFVGIFKEIETDLIMICFVRDEDAEYLAYDAERWNNRYSL
jgi:hypothetical protein